MRHFAGKGAEQERVIAKGPEEREQLLAGAAVFAAHEAAPEGEGVVVGQAAEREGVATG